jgi:hypothetical protein
MVVERSADAAARHDVEFMGARKRNSPKLRGRETTADHYYTPRDFKAMLFFPVWHFLPSKFFCPSHPCQYEIAMFITRGRVSSRLVTKHTLCFSEQKPLYPIVVCS